MPATWRRGTAGSVALEGETLISAGRAGEHGGVRMSSSTGFNRGIVPPALGTPPDTSDGRASTGTRDAGAGLRVDRLVCAGTPRPTPATPRGPSEEAVCVTPEAIPGADQEGARRGPTRWDRVGSVGPFGGQAPVVDHFAGGGLTPARRDARERTSLKGRSLRRRTVTTTVDPFREGDGGLQD